jgi:hypothetical protein
MGHLSHQRNDTVVSDIWAAAKKGAVFFSAAVPDERRGVAPESFG